MSGADHQPEDARAVKKLMTRVYTERRGTRITDTSSHYKMSRAACLVFAGMLSCRGVLGDVDCGGGLYCNDGSTCCPDGKGAYNCCPDSDATCCDDHLHCCPRSHPVCDLKTHSCGSETGGSQLFGTVPWLTKRPPFGKDAHVLMGAHISY